MRDFAKMIEAFKSAKSEKKYPNRLEEYIAKIVGRMCSEQATSFDDSEIERCLLGCVGGKTLIPLAKEMKKQNLLEVNTLLNDENTSWGWSVDKIKEGDKILVCKMRCYGNPLTTCDRHVKGVRVAKVEKVEVFGGHFIVSTSEGEVSLTRCNSVTFFGK